MVSHAAASGSRDARHPIGVRDELSSCLWFGLWHRLAWYSLPYPLMGARILEVCLILLHQPVQMSLAQDQEVVWAFSPYVAQEPLTDCVCFRCSERNRALSHRPLREPIPTLLVIDDPLNRWRSQELLPEEDRARQHVGELLRWHPAALCLYAGEAHAASWQNVEALVLEGNLNPEDFGELAGWIQKSWERLSLADQEALAGLRRILREASTFGTGFAAAVWDQELPQAVLRISRLEDRGLIERVSQEPQPWQEMIQRAYGGEERYRLMPLLRLLDIRSLGGQAEHAPSNAEEIRRLRDIECRAKALPIGPGQIPWQFRLANLFVLPVAWLLRRDSGRLEERLVNLWNRQGLHPPAEVWLTFQKSRWTYLSFGYALGVFMLLLGGWYLKTAFQEGDALWILVSLFAWVSALPTVYLFIRQRASWLWLLGLHGQETTELKWTWRVARFFGLHQPSDQMEILSWKTGPPSLQ
jgi:hypothetical protein